MALCTQADPVALPGCEPGTATPGHGSSGRWDHLHNINKFAAKRCRLMTRLVHRLPAGKLEPRSERQRELKVASKTLDKIHVAEQKALGATADLQQQQKEALRLLLLLHPYPLMNTIRYKMVIKHDAVVLPLSDFAVAVDLPQRACDMPRRSRAGKRRRSARGLRSG